MNEEEHDKEYKRRVMAAFGSREVEPMQIIHDGKDDPSFLLALAYRTKEAFRKTIKFAMHRKEDEETARARRKNRARAIKETNERIEARYLRRKMKNPDKDISRFVSTSDMDINALLDVPDRIGQKINVIHTGQLNADRKLIKKEVKKKIKQKKQTLKVAKKDDRMIEIEKIEADILALKAKIKVK